MKSLDFVSEVLCWKLVPLLKISHLLSAGILFSFALTHAGLGWKHERRLEHWLFAATSFLAGLEAVATYFRFTATTVPEMILAMKVSFEMILLFAAVLLWFVRTYARIEGLLIPILITIGLVVHISVMTVLPYTLLFESITGIVQRQLPWGETIWIPVGKVHPLFLVGDLAPLSVALFHIYVGKRLWATGPRSRAVAYTIGMAPLILFIYPHGTLVHLGWLLPPHLYSFGFLTMGAMMSKTLAEEALRSAELAREVEENERRWRALRENVDLLVVGCTPTARFAYVNPYMEKVTGYRAEELLGREIASVVLESERQTLQESFAQAIRTGETHPNFQLTLVTKDGRHRVASWSSVVLRGVGNTVAGTLSIGMDVTEQRAAEFDRDQALAQIQQLKVQLERENTFLRLELEKFEGASSIIGRSDAIRYVLAKVQQVAKTEATVLIEGETGVGKELVAKAVHEQSARSKNPLIRVNCAALPPSLVESELFGHEKGAFTGADRERKGRFELAENGTILLDEIGELGLDVQVKLLRVLQWGEYERVGSSQTRKCSVRVIAATNRSLLKEVAAGRFREDLFYRLNVFPISVPPLRERREDIPELVMHFVRRFADRYQKDIREVSAEMIHRLSQMDWSGNIRELENAIERMVITSSGSKLEWPKDMGAATDQRTAPQGESPLLTLAEMEKRYIEQVLVKTSGQISGKGGAAEILGINANTLRARMAKLGVQRPAEKANA